MHPHRTTPECVFSGLSAAFLRDRRVSWCAVGVLTYLLALPDRARVTLRALSRDRAQERSRIAAALRELEELRYLRRVVRAGQPADQLRPLYEVFEAPYESGPPTGETGKAARRHVSPGARRAEAARLLLSLGDFDRRLTLGGAEALRLAPLVQEWWRRGASSAEVRAAVTWDAPRRVRTGAGYVEARLRVGPRSSVGAAARPATAVEVDFRTPGGRLARLFRGRAGRRPPRTGCVS
ncbi:hypothetical protein SZN_23271 [Streptomyces zinciresistens K42]|uniref:Uncharacterized protein n=1 Tax=Streptomyces zinciresistens K42 TaxID=700597 RepID=G2GGM0_9ACTN|nr:hypothetical protein [Streptomyces zinciresistens]EGX57361.1 hypothetical protein SZN_23271 [Streptomyces zinciresistens K42]